MTVRQSGVQFQPVRPYPWRTCGNPKEKRRLEEMKANSTLSLAVVLLALCGVAAAVDGKRWYWANTAGEAVPDGFNQEATIKDI